MDYFHFCVPFVLALSIVLNTFSRSGSTMTASFAQLSGVIMKALSLVMYGIEPWIASLMVSMISWRDGFCSCVNAPSSHS